MVAAALVVESLFLLLGWVPEDRHTAVVDAANTFNYTTVLDMIFGAAFLILMVVFFRTGGPEMMRMMEGADHVLGPRGSHSSRDYAHHQHGGHSK
jgi:hypothetical protein